jgi:hypothetical protein
VIKAFQTKVAAVEKVFGECVQKLIWMFVYLLSFKKLDVYLDNGHCTKEGFGCLLDKRFKFSDNIINAVERFLYCTKKRTLVQNKSI